MDIDEEIDKCLKKLYEANGYTAFASELHEDFMYNVPHAIDRTMINKGLVESDHEARTLTESGIRISQQGGWKIYLNRKREAEQKETAEQSELQRLNKKLMELEIREKQVSFTQIKHWFWIWIIGIVISAVLAAWLQSLFTK